MCLFEGRPRHGPAAFIFVRLLKICTRNLWYKDQQAGEPNREIKLGDWKPKYDEAYPKDVANFDWMQWKCKGCRISWRVGLDFRGCLFWVVVVLNKQIHTTLRCRTCLSQFIPISKQSHTSGSIIKMRRLKVDVLILCQGTILAPWGENNHSKILTYSDFTSKLQKGVKR